MTTPCSNLKQFSSMQAIKAPKLLKTFCVIVVTTIIITTLALIFVPWVQTAYGKGRVTALNPNDRPQPLDALVSGRIKQWFVNEGDFVRAGDPLIEIVDNDALLLQRLEEKRNSLKSKLESTKNAAAIAEIDLKRQKSLLSEGLSSRRTYEQAKIKLDLKQAEVSKVETELNEASVWLAQQDMQIIRAPRDGVIINLMSGDNATSISAGDRIATFIPSNITPTVELFLSGMDIALVQPGQKVRLQFEGWPVVQFSGWPSKAIGTFGGIVRQVDPTVSTNGEFRVIIEPDKNDEPWPDNRFLRLGSHVKGWVLLGTVSVGYELWRNLNNFPPTFSQNMPGV